MAAMLMSSTLRALGPGSASAHGKDTKTSARPGSMLHSTWGTAHSSWLSRSGKYLGGTEVSQRPISRPLSSARGGAVLVHSDIFSRFGRVARATVNNAGDTLVSKGENPIRMLDTVVDEMQDDLIRMRQTSAQVLATQRMLEAKYQGATRSADDWQRRAELAVRADKDELAREALRRKKAFLDLAGTLEGQLVQHTRATESLLGSIRVMETKLSGAKNKKETLKARARAAEGSKMVNEQLGGMLSGLRSSTNSSLAAFAAMEEKVMALEAEAEGAAMMMPIGDVLEGRFAMLEGGIIGVDDELNKMKRAMGGSSKKDGRLSDTLSESGYINIKVY